MLSEESQLDRIERMLKWIILDRRNDTIKKHYHKTHLSDKDLEGALWEKPDISYLFPKSG